MAGFKGFISQFMIWIQAARPKTLLASLAPILLGLGIASSEVQINWPLAGLTLLSAIALQVGTNFVNDLVDYLNGGDTEGRLGPVRAMQSGKLTIRQMMFGIFLVFGISVGAGLILVRQGGLFILLIGLVGIGMGILYTIGTSLLSLYGLSDFMVLAFFGVLAVAGTDYIQTGGLSPSAFVAGVAPGLLSVAILTVNNIRDIDQDKRAGRKTWVVRFGIVFGKWEYLFCLIGAAIIPLILFSLGMTSMAGLIASLSSLLGVPILIQVWTLEGKALNRSLGLTAGLLLVHSLVFSLGWVL